MKLDPKQALLFEARYARNCNHDLAALCGHICQDCLIEDASPRGNKIRSLRDIMWGGLLNVWR